MSRPLPIGGGIENYYRLHARIYDQSRWAFLFGRNEILNLVAEHIQPNRILEIGCGTGHNLLRLQGRFPGAEIHGLDLSASMLQVARQRLKNRVHLWQQPYNMPLTRARLHSEPFDLIVASYALSMFNPGWEQAIDSICQDLRPGGCLALVDFHDTRFAWFRHWMTMNHVRMDAHLLYGLDARLQLQHAELRPAYAGLWHYSLYIGKKPIL